MGKVAYLFSGQGSQYVGMGRDLYDNYEIVRDTLDIINRVLDIDLLNIIFNGPEGELKKTENTQPAILAVSIALMRLAEAKGIRAKGAAGLSLGEYSALVYSGALSFEDALLLVKKRGKYMQEAVPEGAGTMAAIIGLKRQDVLEIVKVASQTGIIQAVNFNCPGQIAVAGEIAAVEKAVEMAKEKGAGRSMVLQVSAPFHSSMLKTAGDKLNVELQKVNFHHGSVPVVANIDSNYYKFTREDIIDKLTRQVYNPVMFEDSIERLIDDGFDTFVEIGPGKALSGFVKRINRDVKICNIEDVKSLEKTITCIDI